MSVNRQPVWNLHLLVALVKRDFQAQYRRSLLGPAWALLYSAIYLALFIAVRSFLNIPSDGQPYALFAAVALVPWTFFAGAVTRAGSSIIVNAALIRKMAVRREVFPGAAVLLSLGDLLIASTMLLGLSLWYDLALSWALLWLPPLLLLLATLAAGVGMGIAAVGVYRRDIILGLPFVIQVWMLGSPIMYPLSVVPSEWRDLYALNPMVGILEGIRAVLLHGDSPDLRLLLFAAAGTAALFLLGWKMFRSLSQYFVDVL